MKTDVWIIIAICLTIYLSICGILFIALAVERDDNYWLIGVGGVLSVLGSELLIIVRNKNRKKELKSVKKNQRKI